MQYALKVFKTEEESEFRTIMRDGEPWFVLADVCRALDIGNPRDAASRLDADERDAVGITDAIGREQSTTVINESGLYSLILTSRKPSAKRFKKWVTAEVLPTIRKTGAYGGKVPAFIARFNANWDRVDDGYFSVINELVIRLYGRLEMLGYKMPDKGAGGKEMRPDISVGKRFMAWLRDNYPEAANDHTKYIHSLPELDVLANQYPRRLLPMYLDFIDRVWVPECAESYFGSRDPAALPYLPKLLGDPNKPKVGMIKQPTLQRFGRPKRKAS